jgi:hypothetical protein
MSKGRSETPRFRALPQEILDGLDCPEGLHTCPLSHVPDWWKQLSRIYSAYDKGLMLEAGGLNDQPAVYIDVMGMITGFNNLYLKEKMKAAAEKAKAK